MSVKNKKNKLYKKLKIKNSLLSVIIAMISITAIYSQQKNEFLKEGWQFVKNDLGGPWEAVRPTKKGSPKSVPLWQEIELPHCFNSTDAVDPTVNYYQGPGWYRNYLDIEDTNGQVLLHFEGAGQKTKVYIHTTKVGEHVGGYDEWTVNITEAVKAFRKSNYKDDFGGKVPLIIRCDNSRDLEMIPSGLSDFNIYGGLYRDLNLQYKPNNYIGDIEVNANANSKKESAFFSLKANFINHNEDLSGNLKIELFSPKGELVFKDISSVENLSNSFSSKPKQIKNPKFWSPSNPNLYRCKITLTTSQGIDIQEQKIGFRDFKFIKKGAFELNGKRLLLRGTHRHEDHAGTAAAMTKDLMTKEMVLMKEMGVNFIRLGHYQQSRHILDLCDSLGILVWEEIPWCRGGLGGKTYKDQARRMLKNMITQHRNHPAVIIWGLGNENDWPGDFIEFDKEKIRVFMSELNDIAHKLDPSRKTAIRRCDFCKDIVDVYSPSIWAGWYRGKFVDYKKVSKQEMEEVDHFLHVEWGASSHARRHSEDPDKAILKIANGKGADERSGDSSLYGGEARVSKDGDWTETYACNLIDWHLKEQENMPWLTGTAYWPFKDFSTPVRPENPVPYVNQKGVLERDFTKKETFYVFQSYWAEKPMVHIYGHSWPTRWGDKNEKKLLKVYSNCPDVELILNGKSLGTKTRNSQDYPAAGLRWEVVLNEGKNHVKVIGKAFGKVVIDEIDVNYQVEKWLKPKELTLSIQRTVNDTIWLEAQAIDENGVKCLDAKNVVQFDEAGDGDLIVNQGTSRGSKKLQLYNGRALIGLKISKGKSKISVESDGLKSAFKTVFVNSNSVSKKVASINDRNTSKFNEKKVLKKLTKKYEKLLTKTKVDSLTIPRSTKKDGTLIGGKSKDWTSGFFPGILWYLYEFSNSEILKTKAQEITAYIEKEQYNGGTHDMGFKIGSSVENGFRLTDNEHYKNVIIKSAETLSTRFNPIVGCIRSWDHNSDKWDYPVIIDNMMNLELLFSAYKLTGNKKFYDIAISHANTTLKNHFRKNNSSYHVIDYNPKTGKVEKKNTHQGYSDESIWTRGQTWGLYGFTTMYRETKDTKYLEQAIKIANLILNHPNMPSDLIPYWDFNAPHIPNEPRDVSAAAITASALIELSQYTPKKKLAKKYFLSAKTILTNLSTEHYQEKNSKYFVLNQSTGSFPSQSEVNVPLVYADYYYVEGLLKLKRIKNLKNKIGEL